MRAKATVSEKSVDARQSTGVVVVDVVDGRASSGVTTVEASAGNVATAIGDTLASADDLLMMTRWSVQSLV